MTTPRASLFTDHSIASLAGTSEEVVPIADWDDDIQEVVLSNPSASNSAFYAFDQAAVANGAGSIELEPGRTHTYQTTSQVRVIGTAGQPFTAYRRRNT